MSINFVEPINADNALDCFNAMYVGSSGSGKTNAVKNINIAADDNVVFFDFYGDYNGTFKGQTVHTYYDWQSFAENLFKARSSGLPFKIARGFDSRVTKEDFEIFCGFCWSLGDGNAKPVNVVLEEFARFSDSTGKIVGYAGDLLSVGRKFGLRTHVVFQRGQEVGKTIMTNCTRKWIGYQERDNDAVYLSKELGIDASAISSLEKNETKTEKRMSYIIKNENHGRGEFEKCEFKFKKK